MIKKIGIIVAFFILIFSFSVKAEVFMEIDCNSKDVTNTSKTNCEVNFVYEEVSVNDIEFDYVTNLDIDFSAISGFNLNKNGNRISIHMDTPLYDDMLNSEYIVKFSIKANNNSKEKESVTLKNIQINKNNDIEVEDITETFNVTTTIVLDNDNFLNSITVDKVPITGFDKNKLEYKNIIVNKNVVYIDAVRSSEKSSASGLGDVFVKPGTTEEHEIEVIAEDKSKRIYKLYITNNSSEIDVGDTNTLGMELSNDNTLKSLEIYNGKEKIPFTYNNKKDTFDITIENSELEKITIKATTSHAKATFVNNYGPRDVLLSMGDNKVLIKVKAENNEEKIYTLNINLKESRNSDNSLSSLKVNDEIVNLIADVDIYEIILPKEDEKTKIEAIPTNEKAKVEFKDIDLELGINKVIIKVTAENGDIKEYQLNITKSDKSILKDIKIDGYILNFDKEKKEYNLNIKDEDELKIILSPSNIEYEILNNYDLQNGSIVTIKVTDANGTNEYRINILKSSELSIFVCGMIILIAVMILALIIYLINKKRKKEPKIDVI